MCWIACCCCLFAAVRASSFVLLFVLLLLFYIDFTIILPFFINCAIPIRPFVLLCLPLSVCERGCFSWIMHYLSHFSPLFLSNPLSLSLSLVIIFPCTFLRGVIQPIECQGGYVERVTSFDSAANDVWSLGVILINLVFGRNPWKQACPRDETFAAFVLNNDFLQTILPMSDELNEIIKSVFCLNPRKRLSLPEFARRVQGCSSFTTGGENPSHPSSSPRAAAAAAAAAGTTGAEQTTPIRFHFAHDALLCNSRDNKAQSQGQDSGVCVELHSVA